MSEEAFEDVWSMSSLDQDWDEHMRGKGGKKLNEREKGKKMIVDRLNPCPFCGHNNLLEYFNLPVLTHTPTKVIVYCSKCGAQGPVENTKFEALESWNRRAGEEAGL